MITPEWNDSTREHWVESVTQRMHFDRGIMWSFWNKGVLPPTYYSYYRLELIAMSIIAGLYE
jgi:hypothetical protein